MCHKYMEPITLLPAGLLAKRAMMVLSCICAVIGLIGAVASTDIINIGESKRINFRENKFSGRTMNAGVISEGMS